MKILKRLTYLKPVIELTRRLGLHKVLRQLYFVFARPKSGILELNIAGISARFSPHTPEELRMLEAMYGEQPVLDALIRALQPGDVVYDIGSNVGLYAVFLAKAVGDQGQVIAFEPEAQSHQHLLGNLELNCLRNVRVFRKAVGDVNGEGRLGIGEVTGNFSLSQLYTREADSQIVEIVKGDDFVQAAALPLPNLVKIDVEGYEHAVILGLRRALASPNCRLVCCEIHPKLLPAGIKEEDVVGLLKELGFQRIVSTPRWDAIHALCYKV